MKKSILISFMLLTCIIFKSESQIFSPQLQGVNGPAYIYYPYGYYQGQVFNGIANGTGTFYFMDGSFYHGNFYRGFWDGPGVLVSRFNGYISGCFSQGVFMGACVSVPNPYQSNRDVRNVVSNVQQNMPSENDDYDSFDINDYNVTQVDANTAMGGQMLGRYRVE